jgi:hypothetical protein
VSALSLTTAGTAVVVEDLTGRHAAALARAAAVDTARRAGATSPDVRVVIERGHRPFDTHGMLTVTRGVRAAAGTVVLDDVGGSGFTQRWELGEGRLEVRTRWTPSALERGATLARSRAAALSAQVLLHYPALWWAGTRGRVPLHVSVVEIDGVGVLLAGPGGVGKSTLVAEALAGGVRATCDNVAASDGDRAFGLREPLRLRVADGGPADGARTTHGRRELPWTRHVPSLLPELVVVVRRGDGPAVRPLAPESARDALVAGTYAAGELRRFWPLTAVVGLATAVGPVHPRIEAVADGLTRRLPCLELELGRTPGVPLHTLLGPHLDRARRQESTR